MIDDDDREPDPGCVYGDECLCPHPYHLSWECFTVEDAEAMAIEMEMVTERYEWTDPESGENWAACRNAGLPITRSTLARRLGGNQGWMPEGCGPAALEMLRMASREQQATAIARQLIDDCDGFAKACGERIFGIFKTPEDNGHGRDHS